MKRFSLTAVLALGIAAAPASAQQLMAWPVEPMPRFFPGPRPLPSFPPEAVPVTMSGYRVEGTVTDRVAELTYRITFHNPADRRLEGVLMVPIPADAALSGFSMTVGGKDAKGELIEAGQAASIYESIVRQLRDPGLLELVGERMFRARVFPIEPRGDVVATLKLTQTLPQSGGMISLRVPLRPAGASSASVGRASARVELRTTLPMRSLFSPNPDVRVERRGEREAVATYEEGAGGPQDLALMFSLRQDPLAAGVLAYHESGEDGTFLLSLSPKTEDAAAKAAPKDIIFVLDRSGSMADDGKIDQAKKALEYCVSRLGPDDRFGIVDFATDWNSLEERLLPGDADNKARAKRYIEGLEAGGGTNIEAALEEGLKLLARSDGRVPMVFFLTDGVPTVGQTDVNALLAKVAGENRDVKARVFDFGVGSDVNTLLLDKLADGGRGARDYVAPGEDIEAKVSSLYQKVSRPALTDVKIEWRGLETADVYPRPVPDLFHGSELTLYGRYHGHGRGTLIVTGKSGGRDVRFEYPVDLPAVQTSNSFLPRLWAARKVAHELDALRLLGGPADPEAVASIVKLAKKYGIVTPYTSFLVTEEGADGRAAEDQGRRRFEALSRDALSSGFRGGAGAGGAAQADSLRLMKMSGSVAATRGAASPAAPAAALRSYEAEARAELKAAGRDAVETRTVGDKTFYRRAGIWIDADAESPDARSAPRRTVKARGNEYFDLLAKSPELARWFALGDDVEVLWRGTVYRVVSAR
ncbi:MAG: VWA domain-containing protein [Elusimicrobia bacterium]|nr:VWA domain-containing protein [Elusimicrobiota bacterium]